MRPEVLIVGAGPVGLVVAIQLAHHGVGATIVERNLKSTSHSKALSLSAASLKALHGMGLSGELEHVGKPISDIDIFYNHRRCAHIDKRRLGRPYPHYLSMPQPETERILRDHLRASGEEVRFGTTLVALEQREDGVLATTVDEASGREDTGEYRYVVGCDGARSTVRGLAGIAFDGFDYDDHFVMGDVSFDRPSGIDATSYHVLDDGFLIFLPIADELTRLVVGKPGALPTDRTPPDRDELQKALDRFHGGGLRIASVPWSSSAPFFNRLASTNRIGRVLLAGDAFHLFSPIGGQGMNTGIQDAVNLGWKLAYDVSGRSLPALLETYTPERYSAVAKAAALTAAHTEAILRRREETGLAGRYIPSMANRGFYRDVLPWQFSGLGLDQRPTPDALVGRHVPYRALETTVPGIADTYDIPKLGRNAILVDQVHSSWCQQITSAFSEVADLMPMRRETISSMFEGAELDVVVVRPDGYIGYAGGKLGLDAYFGQLYREDALSPSGTRWSTGVCSARSAPARAPT